MGNVLGRVLGDGFRVFFLSAGIFAVLAVGWWTLYLGLYFFSGPDLSIPFSMAPVEWHAHELVFGYGGAALGGFLLTAVPNWTGAPGGRRLIIGAAAGLWLAGRLAIFWSDVLPFWMVAGIDLAFLPFLWVKIALMLLRRPKPPNMLFLAFLSLTWGADLACWLGWAGVWPDGAAVGLQAGLMALAGMVLVIAGRVGPGFTRNAMHREGIAEVALPRDWSGFTPIMLAAAILLPATTLIWPGSMLAALIALLAGGAQLFRQSRWGFTFAARRPILAILHGAAALTGLGLVLISLTRFMPLSEIAAQHLLAIGGIGGMTLAMMSRATLGHSGRPLVAPPALVIAYLLIPIAAGLRWAASEWLGGIYLPGIFAAALLWIIAFTLYLIALLPAFLGPRHKE